MAQIARLRKSFVMILSMLLSMFRVAEGVSVKDKSVGSAVHKDAALFRVGSKAEETVASAKPNRRRDVDVFNLDLQLFASVSYAPQQKQKPQYARPTTTRTRTRTNTMTGTCQTNTSPPPEPPITTVAAPTYTPAPTCTKTTHESACSRIYSQPTSQCYTKLCCYSNGVKGTCTTTNRYTRKVGGTATGTTTVFSCGDRTCYTSTRG